MKFKHLYIVIFCIFLFSACGRQPGQATLSATIVPSVESDQAKEVSPTAPATAAPLAQHSQSGSFFAINEVGVGPDGFVAMTNFTNVPVSLAGLYLCQGSDCFALPDESVEGGETVRIAAGKGEGLENVIATQATFGELRPEDGEIALLNSTNTDDPKSYLVYLQWGSTPHALTNAAVEAGLWMSTSYAPTSAKATRLFRIPESGLWIFEEK